MEQWGEPENTTGMVSAEVFRMEQWGGPARQERLGERNAYGSTTEPVGKRRTLLAMETVSAGPQDRNALAIETVSAGASVRSANAGGLHFGR